MNPTRLPQVMVATAEHRSVADVLQTIIRGIAECSNVVLARIWLVGPSSGCAVCRHGAEGPDLITPCLHLVASAGSPSVAGVDYSRVDGDFHRFRMGERKIGGVAETGEPLLLVDLADNPGGVARPEWVAQEGIQTVAAQPMVYAGEVLGVLALFDRGQLAQEDLDWLRVFADYAAVSVANARAAEEIDHLRARLEEENLYLREEVSAALGLGEFVGESPALQKVLRQVQLAAPTDASILITGESGTGKELVARAIHGGSSRAHQALIKVNCSAVPEHLFESEFFGHARGAFTGAVTARPGRFELADGGTIFLDEIGELPLAMQSKLLRVLQEREFERVGEARTRSVNVRVIAATNRDLQKEVEAGRFRQDLFYRLSVFPLTVPPLRERREDIPKLALHFVAQSARRLKRSAPRVPKSAMDELCAHPWPGNVRELQNIVERAMILWQGGPLCFQVSVQPPPSNATQGVAPRMLPRILTRSALRDLERTSIAAALEQAGGKVSGSHGAAELLGMKPTTLSSRIRSLRLHSASPR